jgi:hypothetical protein
MAPCSRCGEDTELHLNNLPICLGCSAFLERENEERKAMQKAKNAAAAGVPPEDLKKSG